MNAMKDILDNTLNGHVFPEKSDFRVLQYFLDTISHSEQQVTVIHLTREEYIKKN